VFIAVSDFGAWKKNYLKPVNFPYHTQAKVTSHPREGLKNQIPHSPGTENSQMLGFCPGVGMLKFRFDRFVISSRWKFDRYVFRCTAKWAFRFAWQNFLDFTFYNSTAHFCVSVCIRWRLYSNIFHCLLSWGKTFSLVNWYGILRTSWPSSVSISLSRRRIEETRVSPPKYESAKNLKTSACEAKSVFEKSISQTFGASCFLLFSLNGCEIMLFHRHREIVLLMMMILITRDSRNPTKKRQESLNSRIQQGSVDNNPAGERRINEAISSA